MNPEIRINDHCSLVNDSDKVTQVVCQLQNGPIKEVGANGCQIDDLIELCKRFIEYHNEKFPCRENAVAITKLDEANLWLLKRRLDREKRGVEGTNKK